jgi:O-antigen ligase
MKRTSQVRWLILLIWLAPLPFGSVARFFEPFFYAWLTLTSLVLLWSNPEPMPTIPHLTWMKRLLWALGAMMILQILPLPRFIVTLISPEHQHLYLQLQSDPSFWGTLSLIPSETIAFLARNAVLLLFLLALVRLRLEKHEMMTLVRHFVLSATAQVLFGIIKLANGNKKFFLFFYPDENGSYSEFLTGTLGNPDHFSFWLQMALPLSIMLLLWHLKAMETRQTLRQRLIGVINADRSVWMLAIPPLILGAGIILTGCRAGLLSMVLSFLVFMQLTTYHRRSRVVRKKLKAIFIGFTLIALFIGVQQTWYKILSTPDTVMADSGRMLRWPNTMELVKDFPLLGSGMGTYRYAFYLYDTDISGRWSTHAHNDYLETLSDGGIVGLLLMLGLCAMLGLSVLRMWISRRHPEMKMIGIGLLSAFVAVLIHSFFDFSLRIPSNAMFFVMLIALSIRIGTYKREA